MTRPELIAEVQRLARRVKSDDPSVFVIVKSLEGALLAGHERSLADNVGRWAEVELIKPESQRN
jgi:hypothetical protein